MGMRNKGHPRPPNEKSLQTAPEPCRASGQQTGFLPFADNPSDLIGLKGVRAFSTPHPLVRATPWRFTKGLGLKRKHPGGGKPPGCSKRSTLPVGKTGVTDEVT
jgi:hypothetical protein